MRSVRDHRPVGSTLVRLVAAVLALAALCAAGGQGAAQAAATTPFVGTLGTKPEHAAAESRGGVKVAMMELSWRDYEPAQGVWNVAYETTMKARLASLRAAGMRVTLGLGLQYAPAWALAMPNSRFVDQLGHASSQLNLVFSNRLREAAAAYLRRLSPAMGLAQGSIWAVRLTSGAGGEVLYPPGGTFWAFDAAARTGAGLPPGLARNPFPSWKPGTAGLTTAQRTQWVEWYVGALDHLLNWQQARLHANGFHGWFQVVTPGAGTRPHRLAAEMAQNLPGGYTAQGSVWHRLYAKLPDRRDVMVDVSSVGDGSARDVGCAASDASVALNSSAVDGWGSTRWLVRVAREYGLPVVGENPGWGGSHAFQQHYLDGGPAGLLAVAMRLARQCSLRGLYWAHDDQVWTGTTPLQRLLAWTTPNAPLPPPAP